MKMKSVTPPLRTSLRMNCRVLEVNTKGPAIGENRTHKFTTSGSALTAALLRVSRCRSGLLSGRQLRRGLQTRRLRN